MFKLFHKKYDNSSEEVIPLNGIYIVYEIYHYQVSYSGEVKTTNIFIEDEPVDTNLFNYDLENIWSKEGRKFFEDYFGYLTLTINSHKFFFEVRIQKLKVPELEDILVYLWNQDPIIFNNLLSKSTVKSKLTSENTFSDFSSKFTNVFEDFYNFFRQQLYTFKAIPHTYLKSISKIKEYHEANISTDSIEWVLHNFDELEMNYGTNGIENLIRIGNKFGLIDNILSKDNVQDYNVYENQIILGVFAFVNQSIKEILVRLDKLLAIKQTYDKEFFSINQFKILPFIKLKNDISRISSNIKSLNIKYKNVFKDTIVLNSLPKLTAVFAKKKHYYDSYKKIKQIRDLKFSIDGELNLLNIKKISTLYERYNLYVIINHLNSKKPKSFQSLGVNSDGVSSKFIFEFPDRKITLYFDQNVSNQINEIGLQRITKGSPYRPDYIIKIEFDELIEFVVLDAKYSTEGTMKSRHVPNCVEKYIMDIGLTNQHHQKLNALYLLYPGEVKTQIFGNISFKPVVGILPSKINKNYLIEVLDSELFNTPISVSSGQ